MKNFGAEIAIGGLPEVLGHPGIPLRPWLALDKNRTQFAAAGQQSRTGFVGRAVVFLQPFEDSGRLDRVQAGEQFV